VGGGGGRCFWVGGGGRGGGGLLVVVFGWVGFWRGTSVFGLFFVGNTTEFLKYATPKSTLSM